MTPARPDLDAIKARHAVYHDGELALDRCRVCALVAWVEALTEALQEACAAYADNCAGGEQCRIHSKWEALLPPPAPR